ncbi:DHHW family protein [Cohnella yongneupensis]|uniref:DHHW family protein n=1 Tax=Cohnella yongneupensis TaxID=425006 RepID=A0ABW0QZI4_9BACL
MKSKHAFNIALFLIPIVTITAMNLFASKDQTVSLLEKRDIQPMPKLTLDSIVDGTYTKQFDNYYSDHFVMRESMVETGSNIKSLKGWNSSDGVALVEAGGNNMSENLGAPTTEGQPEATGAATDNSDAVPVSADVAVASKDDGSEGVVQTEKSTYLVIKDKAMLLYHSSAPASADYAATLNRLRAALKPNVNLYSLLVPSQVEFVEEAKYKKLNDSQKDAFANVYAQTDKGVIPVPAYAHIEPHKGEYVYYRSDHHWTTLGAYYAYEGVAEAMGVKALPLSSFKKQEIKNFLGSAYSATLNTAMKKNPDTITTYMPTTKFKFDVYKTSKPKSHPLVETTMPTDGRGGYAVFLGGDFSLGRITTDVHNGKRLLLVKDSYANAMVPFLVPHFEEIDIVDPRYYKGNLLTLVKDRKITDVMLENSPIVTTYNSLAKMIDALVVTTPAKK